MERLLQKEPSKRITIPEIREHPWVLQTARPLPSREENCAKEIIVSEEEIEGAFKPFYTPIHILVSTVELEVEREKQGGVCESVHELLQH